MTLIFDRDGWLPIHHAAASGDLRELKRLLASGSGNDIDVNAKTREDFFLSDFKTVRRLSTALHVAAQFDRLDIIRCLVENGADVDALDSQFFSPMDCALLSKRQSIVEFFAWRENLPNRIDRYRSPMFAASSSFPEEIVVLYLLGFDVDRVTATNRLTPLTESITFNRVKSLRILLALIGDKNDLKKQLKYCSSLPSSPSSKLDEDVDVVQQTLMDFWKKSESEREQMKENLLNRVRAPLSVRLMQHAQPDIIGICLAFAPLELPPYVLLWITDFLPNYNLLSHHKKIELITSVRDSIWKVKGRGE